VDLDLNAMTQQILVALIVTLAAVFCVWKLMPARRRMQLLQALDAWSARRPRLAGWRQRWLKPRIARAAGIGCDGCDAHSRQPPQ
jgi:uncharacterized protein DUF6587